MALKESAHNSNKENFLTSYASMTENAVLHIQLPDSTKSISLTSSKFEHWFATLENEINPSKKDTDYLSTEFLSRFGIQHPEEIIAFLKSPAGQSTLTLIAEH